MVIERIIKSNLLQLFTLIIVFVSCSNTQGQNFNYGIYDRLSYTHKDVPDELKEPNNCVEDDYVYTGADVLSKIEDFGLDISGVKVTDKEVNEFGDAAIREIINSKKYRFIKRGEELMALRVIMNELLSVRKNPSKIKYQLHLIDDKMINAFTVGGHIVITTGIVNFVNKSQSAIAAIIGHEIGHNEKGHLSKSIKKIKIAEDLGSKEVGQIASVLQRVLTPAFNQPKEIESDLYGVDLCYAAGFDPRLAVKTWVKMNNSHNEGDGALASFLRSHPYSKQRSSCIKKYIKLNYNL
jgi:predicted Zn-dependent protease